MDDKQVVRCPSCGCELALLEFDGLGCCFSGKHAADCYTGFPKLFDTPEAALAAAQKRRAEPNRVLTLEELKELPEVVWHEENKTVFAPATPLEPKIPYSISTNVVCEGRAITYTDWDSHGFGGYNKYWRCWLRKPTDQERAAVPWEGETK